jgi:ABC-type Fe3+/spermidine/putrescine transport system ATPase subunit
MARGDPVVCSVRPESVRLHRAEGPTSEQVNQLTGEVQSIMYLGDSEQYSLRLADGSFVRAVEYNPTARKAEVGDRVALRVDAHDVIVLPREEPGD